MYIVSAPERRSTNLGFRLMICLKVKVVRCPPEILSDCHRNIIEATGSVSLDSYPCHAT